jgi:hypothetical protein
VLCCVGLISRLCRHTASATAWTLGTLFLALVGVPYLLSWTGDGMVTGVGFPSWHYHFLLSGLLRLWHPVFAMASLHTARYSYAWSYYRGDAFALSSTVGFLSAGVLFLTGCVLLAILHFLLRNAALDEARRQGS